MAIKLGDISPLAGAISGKGMFGRGLSKLADSGMGMLIPMSYLAQSQRDKRRRRADGTLEDEQPTGMKKGGKVKAKKMAKGGSASKRGDGIAQRGKTKGSFV